jgi:hypothetical protein
MCNAALALGHGALESESNAVDEIVREYSVHPTIALLNIDGRGYEEVALDGSHTFLRKFASVRIDLLLALVCAGHALMPEIGARTNDEVIEPLLTESTFINPHSGWMHPCDGVYDPLCV